MAISSFDNLISGWSSSGFQPAGLLARTPAATGASRVLGARKKTDEDDEEGEKEEESEEEEEAEEEEEHAVPHEAAVLILHGADGLIGEMWESMTREPRFKSERIV